MTGTQLPIELAELTSMLAALSSELVQARLAVKPVPVDTAEEDDAMEAEEEEPSRFDGTRRALSLSAECRGSTSKARREMDERYLALQNLLFEKQHLEDEIRKCQEYESRYESVPLLPLDELRTLAASDSPPNGLVVPLPEDEHELMLARLDFELAERKRYDEEKKALGTNKAKLIKDNEIKKNNLEELEKKLDGFVEEARSIQAKLHEGDEVMIVE